MSVRYLGSFGTYTGCNTYAERWTALRRVLRVIAALSNLVRRAVFATLILDLDRKFAGDAVTVNRLAGSVLQGVGRDTYSSPGWVVASFGKKTFAFAYSWIIEVRCRAKGEEGRSDQR